MAYQIHLQKTFCTNIPPATQDPGRTLLQFVHGHRWYTTSRGPYRNDHALQDINYCTMLLKGQCVSIEAI